MFCEQKASKICKDDWSDYFNEKKPTCLAELSREGRRTDTLEVAR